MRAHDTRRYARGGGGSGACTIDTQRDVITPGGMVIGTTGAKTLAASSAATTDAQPPLWQSETGDGQHGIWCGQGDAGARGASDPAPCVLAGVTGPSI